MYWCLICVVKYRLLVLCIMDVFDKDVELRWCLDGYVGCVWWNRGWEWNGNWMMNKALKRTLGTYGRNVHFVWIRCCWMCPKILKRCTFLIGARCLRSDRSPPRSSKELSSLSPKSFGQTETLPEILDSLCLEPKRPSIRPRMSPNKLGSLCLEPENSQSNQRLARRK